MRIIPISALPVQSFTFNYGDYRYDFTFRDNGDFMTYDVSIDEEVIIPGFPFIIGQLLIPYKYLEADGNFILKTDSETEANYELFGDTQIFYYVTSEEAEYIRSVD